VSIVSSQAGASAAVDDRQPTQGTTPRRAAGGMANRRFGARDRKDPVERGEQCQTDQESRSAPLLAEPILTAMDITTASQHLDGTILACCDLDPTLDRAIGRSLK
jgi:hypothetical protein